MLSCFGDWLRFSTELSWNTFVTLCERLCISYMQTEIEVRSNSVCYLNKIQDSNYVLSASSVF